MVEKNFKNRFLEITKSVVDPLPVTVGVDLLVLARLYPAMRTTAGAFLSFNAI